MLLSDALWLCVSIKIVCNEAVMVSLRVFPHMQIINHGIDWKHMSAITASTVHQCIGFLICKPGLIIDVTVQK